MKRLIFIAVFFLVSVFSFSQTENFSVDFNVKSWNNVVLQVSTEYALKTAPCEISSDMTANISYKDGKFVLKVKSSETEAAADFDDVIVEVYKTYVNKKYFVYVRSNDKKDKLMAMYFDISNDGTGTINHIVKYVK